MTKTELTQPGAKVAPTPEYTAVQLTSENAGHIQQASLPGTTCWYVFGILSTIFCCLPCGVIGLVHAMIAKHEGERGNVIAHRRRLYQAKCWTSWSIALGLLFTLVTILAWCASLGMFDRVYGYCGNYLWGDDYIIYPSNSTTTFFPTEGELLEDDY